MPVAAAHGLDVLKASLRTVAPHAPTSSKLPTVGDFEAGSASQLPLVHVGSERGVLQSSYSPPELPSINHDSSSQNVSRPCSSGQINKVSRREYKTAFDRDTRKRKMDNMSEAELQIHRAEEARKRKDRRDKAKAQKVALS